MTVNQLIAQLSKLNGELELSSVKFITTVRRPSSSAKPTAIYLDGYRIVGKAQWNETVDHCLPTNADDIAQALIMLLL